MIENIKIFKHDKISLLIYDILVNIKIDFSIQYYLYDYELECYYIYYFKLNIHKPNPNIRYLTYLNEN
jgi:hypothetical protein